jgi:quinol-cytochrome oxidoreductase complex cytochrome b subunit
MKPMNKKNVYTRLMEWLDLRIGLTETMLRPVPEYSLNPFYWLGGLMVIVFLVQGLAGILMLLYYVPLPDQAYSSTVYVFKNVPLGQLIETLHLYGAYAMILLAFMHLMRNYFANVHKKPRELMWVAGMLLGFVVLGFGLTGYLLPWTVVSISATDVAVGMLGLLPPQLSGLAKFMITGSGSDAALLRRFVAIHTVILPAAFLSLLGIKFYMFETHGPAYTPAYIKDHFDEVEWFPKVLLYVAMVGSAFIGLLLAISALFPFSLPPAFTPAAAAAYVSQPDWYFLWMYQVLKFSFFEGPGIVIGLGGVTLFFVLLLLLPFYDRGTERNLGSRPLFTTIGVLIVAELITLTVWGYLTPGQVIPGSQAVTVVGGVAAIVVGVSLMIFRRRKGAMAGSPQGSTLAKIMITPFLRIRLTAVFLLVLVVASVTLASLTDCLLGRCSSQVPLAPTLLLFILSVCSMTLMTRRLVGAFERSERI